MPPPVTAESYVYSRSSGDGGASAHAAVGGGGACSDGSMSLSGYNQSADFAAGYLDPDALPCGPSGGVPAVVLPSASSSSTLNSMAGLSPAATTTTTTTATDEPCNNNNSSSNGFESTQSCNHLPWLELGTSSCAAGVDHYGAALDELKWSDYVFDGYGGGQQYLQGQRIYGDSKDAVQFDAHGLSSWCLN
uniref:Uncharacterized protein n=1 Tax=Arundo donax TaxID=35708 RepID=A0A0A9D2E3_ARUDO